MQCTLGRQECAVAATADLILATCMTLQQDRQYHFRINEITFTGEQGYTQG